MIRKGLLSINPIDSVPGFDFFPVVSLSGREDRALPNFGFGWGRSRLYISAEACRRDGAMTNGTADTDRLNVRGIELEVVRRGAGSSVLLLHGFQTIDREARFLELLGRHGEVVAPSGPGFGNSPRPQDFDTVYDLVHLYLELLETFPGDKVALLGLSFGGWLAAEMAAACSHRLDKLVLVDPVGIKVSDRETPDILAIFKKSPDAGRRRSWPDPDSIAPLFNHITDDT